MKIVPYQAPKWFYGHPLVKKHLKNVLTRIPAHRIELVSSRPTPIQQLARFKSLSGYDFLVKRDDLTHHDMHVQGNKLRKLEFIFADVLSKKAENVLTAGGLQSNHCRAVAAVCARLGLQSHLFLRSLHSNINKVNTALKLV